MESLLCIKSGSLVWRIQKNQIQSLPFQRWAPAHVLACGALSPFLVLFVSSHQCPPPPAPAPRLTRQYRVSVPVWDPFLPSGGEALAVGSLLRVRDGEEASQCLFSELKVSGRGGEGMDAHPNLATGN